MKLKIKAVVMHIAKTSTISFVFNNWGSNIIERLATDLQKEFPGIGGFSKCNMFRIRSLPDYVNHKKKTSP